MKADACSRAMESKKNRPSSWMSILGRTGKKERKERKERKKRKEKKRKKERKKERKKDVDASGTGASKGVELEIDLHATA